jgi:hypothetical protein
MTRAHNATGLRARLFELGVYSGLADTVGKRIAIYSDYQGAWSPLIEARCVLRTPATPTIKGPYSKTSFYEAFFKHQ